tara:strand:+ start:967 stop:1314 length:348 start_codon:yes stop_codon:yes gene_type:complete
LAYEEPAKVRTSDKQLCQVREALEAVRSPQTVGAPLLTPHGADGGGVRQVGGATDLLQDGREEVRVAQDVSGSGGGGGRRARGHGCEKFGYPAGTWIQIRPYEYRMRPEARDRFG